MNRIDKKFLELRRKNKKAFIAFITVGDPNLKVTEDLVLAFEKSGVDIVELGVPFSDPLADGPTIQASSQRALKKQVTLKQILDLVSRIRKKSQIPIAFMTYYNPIFYFGESEFAKKASEAGVDGVIIPDLPPEEAGSLIKAARKNHLSTVFFISPTTVQGRIKSIAQASTGFIYYVSLTGVTGARRDLSVDSAKHIKAIKRQTKKPLCVGFGISTSEQVKTFSKISDGVIVGSAIVEQIAKNAGKKNLTEIISKFVSKLSQGLKK